MKSTNINTYLISIVLAVAAWNLKETVNQGKDFAKLEERTAVAQRDLADLRIRMNSNEAQILALRLELARFKLDSK